MEYNESKILLKKILQDKILGNEFKNTIDIEAAETLILDSELNKIDFEKTADMSIESIIEEILLGEEKYAEEISTEKYEKKEEIDKKFQLFEINKDSKDNDGISIIIDSDAVAAKIMLNYESSKINLTEEFIYTKLKERGIREGIKSVFISRLVKHPIYDKSLKIAEGKEALHGNDGYEVFHFDTEASLKPIISEDGVADYKELNLAKNVRKGERLCEIYQPTKGTDGYSIFGDVIPATEGKPSRIKAGSNTILAADKVSILAACDGQVYLKNDEVCVSRVMSVKSVDTSTGNIAFVGTVIVSESVRSGFMVRAGGDIIVKGIVENAVLAAEGNINISDGVNGGGNAKIIAGGSVTSGFIENANVSAKENVYADVILNSNVRCEGKIVVSGKKSCIIGGSCIGGTDIIAGDIGNDTYIPTKVELKYFNKENELAELIKKILKYRKLVDKLEVAALTFLHSQWKKRVYQMAVIRSLYLKYMLNNDIRLLEDKAEKLSASKAPANGGRIQVKYFLYPGADISFYGQAFKNRMERRACTLKLENGSIVVTKRRGI